MHQERCARRVATDLANQKNCEPQERIHCAPKFDKKPCNKNDAPAEKHGIWRKVNVFKLNNKDKTTFYSLSKVWSLLALPKDEITDDGESRNDFGSIEGNHVYRHHVERRVQLYVPKEETLTWATYTKLDVLQESRIDDYSNIEVNRNLWESRTGITKFTTLNETPPKGYMRSRGGSHKFKQLPDLIFCGATFGPVGQRKEKQQWAIEKPKLDNARKWRGISFIDPCDKEFKETMEIARK